MIKKIFLAIVDKHIGFISGLEIYVLESEVVIEFDEVEKHRFELNEMGFPLICNDFSLQEFVEFVIDLFKNLK